MARLLFPLQQPEYIVRPLSPLTAEEAKESEFPIRPWDEAWENPEHPYYPFSEMSSNGRVEQSTNRLRNNKILQSRALLSSTLRPLVVLCLTTSFDDMR